VDGAHDVTLPVGLLGADQVVGNDDLIVNYTLDSPIILPIPLSDQTLTSVRDPRSTEPGS
jgi:hypothetical protein